MHSLNLLLPLLLLSLILLLPADVLHHEDGGDGAEDPAAELVEPGGDVDLAVQEHSVKAQHRNNEDICVTVACQQSVNMLLRLETQLERF